ncbi:UNVERIFIED_CONTAM: hypothetical protein H355_011619 [Colinus virginianus]|nr:hypothetical protein H355_011619 [Colinus virginianus]
MLRTGTVSRGLYPQPCAITPGVSSLDASTWVPAPPDRADFDFSLGEDVSFGPCAVCPPPPESPQPCWRDAAERRRQALGDALEENSQLQEALAQRRDELATLRESNVQLKELASQARQLAAVLDVSAAARRERDERAWRDEAPRGHAALR